MDGRFSRVEPAAALDPGRPRLLLSTCDPETLVGVRDAAILT